MSGRFNRKKDNRNSRDLATLVLSVPSLTHRDLMFPISQTDTEFRPLVSAWGRSRGIRLDTPVERTGFLLGLSMMSLSLLFLVGNGKLQLETWETCVCVCVCVSVLLTRTHTQSPSRDPEGRWGTGGEVNPFIFLVYICFIFESTVLSMSFEKKVVLTMHSKRNNYSLHTNVTFSDVNWQTSIHMKISIYFTVLCLHVCQSDVFHLYILGYFFFCFCSGVWEIVKKTR